MFIMDDSNRGHCKTHSVHASMSRTSLPAPVGGGEAIFLADHDQKLRETIAEHLKPLRTQVIGFDSREECLSALGQYEVACLVINCDLYDLSDQDAGRHLISTVATSVILYGQCCDCPSVVNAMKAGAVDFLPEPIDSTGLLHSVALACKRGRELRVKRIAMEQLRSLYRFLSPREREVLPLVVGGLLNKQAAALLGITEVTLQIHRSQVMRKMRAPSLAALVRMADALGIAPWSRPRPPTRDAKVDLRRVRGERVDTIASLL